MAPSAAVSKRDDGPSTSDDFDLEKTAEEAKSLIEKIVRDVGKKSATRQLIFGSASGWATGFIMMKLGKAAAFTVGSGILALQLANSSGYININWDKLTRGVERVAEQVEGSTSDKKQGLLKKVGRFVDKKLDKAEDLLRKKERKAKRWFNRISGDEDEFVFEEIHVFLASYLIGLFLGISCGIVAR
ncbi:FUN14 domain-containing protein 1-like [Acyrthosiphon pisum]|uniref:ACYPI007484 protein n=1 Tax=Acyrthosiphon pisum TaxID=7029 RepID=C4WSD0_ACYPI|nr:FUN14 domain-containing protein 1-like [Acyrthosiphon pisum]BAH70800.1 ACYPI007484 [Acyrthosiphon pisum]BAH70801.1 ACYPI007484 [Acyrthosiphon pisum]|eukprot:NP_001156244.1 FUN14 domain-containing protein 1-like [Acyrthosiphon pisum]